MIMLVVLATVQIILLLLYVRLYLILQIHKKLTKRRIERYNAAIDYSITFSGLDAGAFLTSWREGDWSSLKSELPLFDVEEDIKLNNDLIEYGIKYGY